MVCVLEVDDRESTIPWSPRGPTYGPFAVPTITSSIPYGPHFGPGWAQLGPIWKCCLGSYRDYDYNCSGSTCSYRRNKCLKTAVIHFINVPVVYKEYPRVDMVPRPIYIGNDYHDVFSVTMWS